MSLFTILGTLFLGPLKLVFEIIFGLANSLVSNPGLAIIFLSLAMNILVLPLYKRADAMQEAARILAPRGVLVMKCQDKVSSGKQYMMHCDIYNWAASLGFEVCDLFILLAKNRLVADWQRNQKHARKFHCYFWVFRKKSK